LRLISAVAVRSTQAERPQILLTLEESSMRVVSRILVAAAIATLPSLASAQSVSPTMAGGFRTEVSPTVATQYIAPAGGQPQALNAGGTVVAGAGQAVDADAGAPDAARSAPAAGPSYAAATAGIRANTTTDAVATHGADHHGGLGTGGALMIVGGAALIIGLIIGGSAGLIVAIAGAAVGLYGLFLFLQ
jgi:hypothetical protein